MDGGGSEAEVLDALVSKYGERILAAPKPRGFNRLAYALPFVVVAVGLVLIAVMLGRPQGRIGVAELLHEVHHPRVEPVGAPGAEALVGRLLEEHPELVEPMQWLAEAVSILAGCDAATCAGRILYSRSFLEEQGRLPRRE